MATRHYSRRLRSAIPSAYRWNAFDSIALALVHVRTLFSLHDLQAQYFLFQQVAFDQKLWPNGFEDVKLRMDLPVPREAIGRIIGRGGHTVCGYPQLTLIAK